MLSTLSINAYGGNQAVPSKEFAVDHQHQQIFRDRPLHQLLQFFGGGCFPMPTDARTFDPIALQTALDGSLVITAGALPQQLASDSLLHFAILLKGLIAAQGHLLVLTVAYSGSSQSYFSASKDYVAGLLAVAPTQLMAPATYLALNLRFHHLADNPQAQLSCQTLNVISDASNQF